MEATVLSKVETDVREFINAWAEMAIADFCQSNGIACSAVETPQFIAMCKALRFVSDDFKLPNCQKLGNKLLDVNFSTPKNIPM